MHQADNKNVLMSWVTQSKLRLIGSGENRFKAMCGWEAKTLNVSVSISVHVLLGSWTCHPTSGQVNVP